jgi:hypothetical protein
MHRVYAGSMSVMDLAEVRAVLVSNSCFSPACLPAAQAGEEARWSLLGFFVPEA